MVSYELNADAWKQMQVLILVVVEDGLVLLHFINEADSELGVLILVVVEDGLVRTQSNASASMDNGS